MTIKLGLKKVLSLSFFLKI